MEDLKDCVEHCGHRNKSVEIGSKFLKGMDDFLRDNWGKLTCNEIYEIYFGFFEKLKDFVGNSNGFTGLSEFLIFRFLYYQLDGDFKDEWLEEPKGRESDRNILRKFVSADKKYEIGANIPISVKEKKRRPDIYIKCNGKLISIIQIKIYLPRGTKTIDNEVKVFKELKNEYPEMKALLLMYVGPSPRKKKGPFNTLMNYKDKLDWFDFIVLKNNPESLSSKLCLYATC